MQTKKLICIFISVLLLINMLGVYSYAAMGVDGNNVYEKIKLMDSEYELSCDEPDEFFTHLINSDVDDKVYLVEFLRDGKSHGYAIATNKDIYEYSTSPSPYYRYVELNDLSEDIYVSAYYSMACYYIDSLRIDSEGYLYYNDLTLENEISTCDNTISGVTPQLQNTHNCIVAALANVFWYWGGNNFSSMRPKTFAAMLNTIDSLFTAYNGYTNNSVPYIAQQYVKTRSSSYSCNSSVYWSSSYDVKTKLKTEINAGYPCMLGYASGSGYYSTGHMTMCYGYYTSGSTMYVRLADGHQQTEVVRAWSSTYNDCVIKVRPYYATNGGTTQSLSNDA